MAVTGPRFPSCLFAFLCLAMVAHCQIPDTVVKLDFQNFEHDTQAATGQTTGRWLVLFNSFLSNRQQQVSKLWETLAQDEDKEVILAEVDLELEENKSLARRFSEIQPPGAVLFRDQQMYVYPGSLTAEDAADKVKEFVREGYQSVKPQTVPGARRTLTEEDMERSKQGLWVKILVGVSMLVVGLLVRLMYAPPAAAPESGKSAAPKRSKRE